MRISPLAVAVLGLLEEQPRHAYDIALTMQQRHMHEHIKLSLGTLYHVVEQLQRLGWVQPTETSREGRRPERTIYTITPEGRRHLLERISELLATPARDYSAFEAGLAFMHQLPRDEAVAMLRRRAQTLRQQIQWWDDKLAALRERGLTRLALIEVEMVQDTRRFQEGWAERIADQIESGALAWEACGPDEPAPATDERHAAGPRFDTDKEEVLA